MYKTLFAKFHFYFLHTIFLIFILVAFKTVTDHNSSNINKGITDEEGCACAIAYIYIRIRRIFLIKDTVNVYQNFEINRK